VQTFAGRKLPNLGHFFSIVSLFEELIQQKIYACGMTRMDRGGFPETLKSVVMEERGLSELCQCGNLTATVWRDKKVLKMSTMYNPLTT